MLWAWQRPENLSFINPSTTGVAFLAGTAQITSTGLPVFEPRLQPLLLPPKARVLAVVRIQSRSPHAPLQTSMLVQQLMQVVAGSRVRGVQIDYDASLSERKSYRLLLNTLADALPVPIGVTALASWCDGDRWLDHAPIFEAVPMFFRMGINESREMRINSAICSSSIGLSTDEPWPSRRAKGLKRIYLFNPHAWTRASYAQALQRLETWK